MADDKQEYGEMYEVEDDSTVRDTDDGGAMVTIDESAPPSESEFYANLAETMPSWELSNLGSELCDILEKDKEARKKRDEQYEEGLRRTGLGDDAPGGASFTGASKVVHPMLTQGCVDFSARVMKELFPPDGPAKDKIIGEQTLEKQEKAERLVKFMNWQMTEQMSLGPSLSSYRPSCPWAAVNTSRSLGTRTRSVPYLSSLPLTMSTCRLLPPTSTHPSARPMSST